MVEVVWSIEATSGLEAIRRYIQQFDGVAADRIARRLIETSQSLDVFPERGRQIGAGIREIALIRPYIIQYRVTVDTVFILRIRHGARRPTVTDKT